MRKQNRVNKNIEAVAPPSLASELKDSTVKWVNMKGEEEDRC